MPIKQKERAENEEKAPEVVVILLSKNVVYYYYAYSGIILSHTLLASTRVVLYYA